MRPFFVRSGIVTLPALRTRGLRRAAALPPGVVFLDLVEQLLDLEPGGATTAARGTRRAGGTA